MTTNAVEDVSSAINVLRSGRRALSADERQALLAEREELRRLLIAARDRMVTKRWYEDAEKVL